MQFLCKYTVVVDVDSDDYDEVYEAALSLMDQNIGRFEYEEA